MGKNCPANFFGNGGNPPLTFGTWFATLLTSEDGWSPCHHTRLRPTVNAGVSAMTTFLAKYLASITAPTDRQILADCASCVAELAIKLNTTISYGGVAGLVGLSRDIVDKNGTSRRMTVQSDMYRLMEAMEAMMDEDLAHGAPFRTAVIVNRNGDIGPGYWNYLDSHGIHVPENQRDRHLHDMRARLHEYYA